MAQYAGSGGGGSSYSAYGSGGSVYNSQVPHAASKPKPKKKSTYQYVKPHEVVRATPRSNYRPSSSGRSGGGGGGGGGYSSRNTSGVGSSSKGAVTPKVKIPSQIDFQNADPTYLAQKAALDKARKDYVSQQTTDRTGYESNYLLDTQSYDKNRVQSLADLENDYAARGMMNSGGYADALTSATSDWDQKKSGLEQARQQYIAGLGSALTNFDSQQGITLTSAAQEAAARRAAKYGIT